MLVGFARLGRVRHWMHLLFLGRMSTLQGGGGAATSSVAASGPDTCTHRCQVGLVWRCRQMTSFFFLLALFGPVPACQQTFFLFRHSSLVSTPSFNRGCESSYR